MKIRALTSFSGIALSMYKGEEMEYDNEVILQDLLQAKYIEEIKETKRAKSSKKEKDK